MDLSTNPAFNSVINPYKFSQSLVMQATMHEICMTLAKGDEIKQKGIPLKDISLHALAEAEIIGALIEMSLAVD